MTNTVVPDASVAQPGVKPVIRASRLEKNEAQMLRGLVSNGEKPNPSMTPSE
jgi:hypothetical protein